MVLHFKFNVHHLNFECLFLGQITVEESLFTYGPNENVSTFANESFVPMFVEDIQWADNETRIAAEQACDGNTVCLFDAASTNDVSIGTNSKDLNVQLVEEKKLLGKATSGAFRWETKNTKAPL